MKEPKYITTFEEVIEILEELHPSIEHDELIEEKQKYPYIESIEGLEGLELEIDHEDMTKDELLDLLDELDVSFTIEYDGIEVEIWCDVIYLGGFKLKNFKYLC